MNPPRLPCLALLLGLAAPLPVVAQGEAKPQGTSLSTIIIYTPQMKALAQFYEKALQLPAPTTVMDVHIGYRLGANYVGFEPVDRIVRNPGGVSAWFEVDNLQATLERLIELGARPGMAPARQPWGDLHATAFDPDGNLVGLIETAKRR